MFKAPFSAPSGFVLAKWFSGSAIFSAVLTDSLQYHCKIEIAFYVWKPLPAERQVLQPYPGQDFAPLSPGDVGHRRSHPCTSVADGCIPPKGMVAQAVPGGL